MFSRWLALLVRTHTSHSVKKLLELQPDTARLVRDGKEGDVPLKAVALGDHIRVRPGERVPIDGRVVAGRSTVDESLVTGESMPESKREAMRLSAARQRLGDAPEQRYGLSPVGIGLALGYGIPGFLFGPIIGRAADRFGRGRLLPLGLALGAIAAGAMIFETPLLAAALAVTVLSLGYDMTQPLFAGIVTSLGGQRRGQAMGLNVFALFIGFGLGSLLFGEAIRLGFDTALLISWRSSC